VPKSRYSLGISGAAIALALSAGPAAAATDFASVVRAILDHQTDGPLTEMKPNQRARMTDCVIDTLSALPSGAKRKIVSGRNIEEQEHLFGQVVDENHAKWRQTIAKACGQIATEE